MSRDKVPMFKAGNKAMLVTISRWGGPRGFRTVEVNKVHKTGRLTLVGSNDQWAHERGYGGGRWCRMNSRRVLSRNNPHLMDKGNHMRRISWTLAILGMSLMCVAVGLQSGFLAFLYMAGVSLLIASVLIAIIDLE